MIEIILKNQTEEDVKCIAMAIAEGIMCPMVILLFGDLGAGKSTFARFLIKALHHEDIVVPSPTFTLLQSYDTRKGPLTHFDLYRLSNVQEVLDIGWDDYIQHHICLVEWPERLDGYHPIPHLQIHFEEESELARNLRFVFKGGDVPSPLKRFFHSEKCA